ncbi:MAG: transglycosylase SLT domain-containing protein [Anaerolineaceae bacterium]
MIRRLIIPFMVILALLLGSCTPASLSGNSTQTGQIDSNQNPSVILPTASPTPLPAQSLSIGETKFYSGDFDNALIEFSAAQASPDPEISAEAMLFIGRIYLQKQEYQTAVEKLGSLVNFQPPGNSRNDGFFFLAKSYEGLQEYQLAADAYQNYLNLNANSPIQAEILVMEGDDLVAAGNHFAALPIYLQAIPLANSESVESIKIKAIQETATNGDRTSAISQYIDLYDNSVSTSTKSAVNLLLGRLYLEEGQADLAYARFQDSVAKFPAFFDTYSGLVALVEGNQPVDDLLRGIVDYYAGQYGLAISAFDRYMTSHPDHDATPIYYKALSFYDMGDYQNEVAEWDKLIQNYPNDPYYPTAFIEKASTQWGKLQQYQTGAQTLLDYVSQAPTSDYAASYLYTAGRIYEQGNLLEFAAQTWERVNSEYPAYEKSTLSQFNAGICYYRLGQYAQALVAFQRNALLTSNAAEKARAELWIGKTEQMLNSKEKAMSAFQQAASDDPRGYYSIRAQELLSGEAPFPTNKSIDLGVDLQKEKIDSVEWMKSKFNIAPEVDLLNSGELANNFLFQRGDAFWKLGLLVSSQSEFETLRQQLSSDAANSFRLMNHLLDLGFNQTAILCARQILDIIGLGDASMMAETPDYFNHVRFGVYFREIVVPAALENKLDPLVIFSVIRQESLFEPEITSSQGATGLMQILPAVGQEIHTDSGWPPNYIDQDLIRPQVNINLGSHYLSKWYVYFGNDMVAALAAYNGGIGNTLNWASLANNDPDLLLEVIPDNYETQNYIRNIREYFEIYNQLYSRP